MRRLLYQYFLILLTSGLLVLVGCGTVMKGTGGSDSSSGSVSAIVDELPIELDENEAGNRGNGDDTGPGENETDPEENDDPEDNEEELEVPEPEVEPVLMQLEVINAPTKTEYIENYQGNGLALTGLQVKAHYNNAPASSNYTNYSSTPANGQVLSNTGNVKVTIQDKDNPNISTNFSVTVKPKTLLKLEIMSYPTSLNYYYIEDGKKFDLSALKIRAIYNNGTEAEGYPDWLSSHKHNEPFSSAGSHTITISDINNPSIFVTFKVQVAAKQLQNIFVSLNKTDFCLGDTFNSSYFDVTGNYDNGKSYKITDFTINPSAAELTKLGAKTYTVTSGGKSDSKTISVNIPVNGFAFVINTGTAGPNVDKFYIPTYGHANYNWKIYRGDGDTLSATNSGSINKSGITLNYGVNNVDYTVVIVPAGTEFTDWWLEAFGFAAGSTAGEAKNNENKVKLKEIITKFSKKSKTSFNYTFANCTNLTMAPNNENYDITTFDNVNMSNIKWF